MFDEVPDTSQIDGDMLLAMAGRLHEAALHPQRWHEVVHAARRRMSLFRASGALTAEQVSWLESMIENATRVCAELARLELERAVAGSAANVVTIGIVVLDTRGRVLRANVEARRLFATSIREGSAGTAGARRESRAPHDMWADRLALVGQGAVTQNTSSIERIVRAEGSPVEALAVVVPSATDPFALPDGRVLVFLVDPDQSGAVDEASLMAAFGLTPAEARMAARLAQGDSVAEAARALGVKITTARTHLSRLLAKTGASRQPQLVRLLLSVPRRARDQSSD